MRKRLLVFFTFTITMIVGCLMINLSSKNHNLVSSQSSDALIIYSDEEVRDRALKKYGDSLVSYENLDDKKIIDGVPNFNQITLNNFYNSHYSNKRNGVNIDGTCTIVACSELIDFYGRVNEEFEVEDNPSEIFSHVFDVCYDSGHTSLTTGTYDHKINDCVSRSFEVYGSKRRGNTNWWTLYGNIEDAVNSGNPIIFSLNDHTTVVKGLTSYTYEYDETVTEGFLWFAKKVIKHRVVKEYFVVLAEGWGRSDGSLFPVGNIGSILNSMLVTWAT